MRWFILTGEYPPQHGGVSDYTRLVAEGLAARGDEVHVWAPPCTEANQASGAVTIHRLPDCFGSAGRAMLERALGEDPAGTRLLVQYVPHSYGWKAMNLPFCVWLWRLRRRWEVTLMFHEVVYPWVKGGRVVRHNFLALVNRVMAWFVARSARRIFASIPAWVEKLCWYAGSGVSPEWLPIPSTMPREVDPGQVADLRERLLGLDGASADRRLTGHFGTFGPRYREALGEVLPALLGLGKGSICFLCIGRGGDEFAAEMRRTHPALAPLILAPGPLSAPDVSAHLSACDLLIQPFPDGVSTRRTSVMASLALGRPVLTNPGHLTESFWAESGAVQLAGSVGEMSTVAWSLLEDPALLARLGGAASALYEGQFSLQRTLDRLAAAC